MADESLPDNFDPASHICVDFGAISTSLELLCQLCRKLIDLSDADGQRPHWEQGIAAGDLFDSAIHGCELCKFISTELDFHPPLSLETLIDLQKLSQGQSGPVCLASLRIDGPLGFCSELVVEKASNPGFQPPAKIYGPYVGRGSSWDHVVRWMTNCQQNHTLCNRATVVRDGVYTGSPSRLIDVSSVLGDTVTIVDTGDEPGRYVTLSHRWGEAQMFSLTRANLSLFMDKGIYIPDLPRTFQDAIQVTRQLGLRYLWIDSLCIVQDSQEDWARESGIMNTVYSRSFVNLAAIGNSLFHQRQQVAYNWNLTIADYPGGETSIVYPKRSWRDQVERATLHQRGWVLQERMLAPRIVHFGRSQVFWECEEIQASEMFPVATPPVLTEILGKSLHLATFLARTKAEHDRKWPQVYRSSRNVAIGHQLWYELIHRYSDCRLTMDTDKLVAISGLAKRMAEILDDTYVAGLWRSPLVDSLNWASHQLEQAAPRTDTYIAPSWSWASTKGSVRIAKRRNLSNLIEIKDIIVVPVEGHDTYGQLASASLVIRGDIYEGLYFHLGLPRVEYLQGKARDSRRYRIRDKMGNRLEDFSIVPDYLPTDDQNGTVVAFLPLSIVPVSTVGYRCQGLLLVRTPPAEATNARYRRFAWVGAPVMKGPADPVIGEEVCIKHGIAVRRGVEVTLI